MKTVSAFLLPFVLLFVISCNSSTDKKSKSFSYENSYLSIGKGRVVTPRELSIIKSRSASHKLYYIGSDKYHHHFIHRKKTTTKYRVDKTKLLWEDEFAPGEKDRVLVEKQLSN